MEMRPGSLPLKPFAKGGDEAEARFFNALKRTDDGPIGLYELEPSGRTGTRELDFVVVDPRFGCKLIEVKAWSRILGPAGVGRVRTLDPRGTERVHTAPQNQARLQEIALRDWLHQQAPAELFDGARNPGQFARVTRMADLKPGMWFEGTVVAIKDFGAFVDIGVGQDGLVPNRELRGAVKLGQRLPVRLLKIRQDGKFALSSRGEHPSRLGFSIDILVALPFCEAPNIEAAKRMGLDPSQLLVKEDIDDPDRLLAALHQSHRLFRPKLRGDWHVTLADLLHPREPSVLVQGFVAFPKYEADLDTSPLEAWRGQKANIRAVVQEGVELLEIAGLEDDKARLAREVTRLDRETPLLAVVGRFSAGKSMAINGLLGRRVLPTSADETTATLTYIHTAEDGEGDGRVEVHYKTQEELDLDLVLCGERLGLDVPDQVDPTGPAMKDLLKECAADLQDADLRTRVAARYLEVVIDGLADPLSNHDKLLGTVKTSQLSLQEEEEAWASELDRLLVNPWTHHGSLAPFVREVHFYLDDPLLKLGLSLVDTPGVGSIDQRYADLAGGALERSDARLWVIRYGGIQEGDAALLERLALRRARTGDDGRDIIVINAIDDHRRVDKSTQEEVLERMLADIEAHGCGGVPIQPTSAENALLARLASRGRLGSDDASRFRQIAMAGRREEAPDPERNLELSGVKALAERIQKRLLAGEKVARAWKTITEVEQVLGRADDHLVIQMGAARVADTRAHEVQRKAEADMRALERQKTSLQSDLDAKLDDIGRGVKAHVERTDVFEQVRQHVSEVIDQAGLPRRREGGGLGELFDALVESFQELPRLREVFQRVEPGIKRFFVEERRQVLDLVYPPYETVRANLIEEVQLLVNEARSGLGDALGLEWEPVRLPPPLGEDVPWQELLRKTDQLLERGPLARFFSLLGDPWRTGAARLSTALKQDLKAAEARYGELPGIVGRWLDARSGQLQAWADEQWRIQVESMGEALRAAGRDRDKVGADIESYQRRLAAFRSELAILQAHLGLLRQQASGVLYRRLVASRRLTIDAEEGEIQVTLEHGGVRTQLTVHNLSVEEVERAGGEVHQAVARAVERELMAETNKAWRDLDGELADPAAVLGAVLAVALPEVQAGSAGQGGQLPSVELCVQGPLADLPWELARVEAPQAGAGFMGLAAPLSRRIQLEEAAPVVRSARSHPVASIIAPKYTDADLPHRDFEVELLRTCLESAQNHGKVQAHCHVGELGLEEVSGILTSSDIVFFLGHAEESKGWRLSGGSYVTPEALSGLEVLPRIVVANACESALWKGPGPTLIEAFMRGGACAYVGTRTSVSDAGALQACDGLVRILLAGRCIGDAVFEMRTRLAERGWATWAAYRLYGCPTETLS